MAAPLAGLAAGPAVRLVLLLGLIYVLTQVDIAAAIDTLLADLLNPF